MKTKVEVRKATLVKQAHSTGKNGDSKKEKQILHEVAFSVKQGEVYAIMGPSGSGKSTLLRLINRLENLTSGDIFIDDKNIMQYPVQELRRKAGLVSQIPFMFEGSVLDNLLYGPKLMGMDSGKKTQEAENLLRWFGFDSQILHLEPGRLSVGEKQRINILRTLLNDPDILMLDEPTASLDPQSSTKILNLIKDINEKKNTTILLVTHIPKHALKTAHRALILNEGKVIEEGDLQEIFSSRHNETVADFLEGKIK